ncbi:MAG: glycerate kinase [Chloroflexi bacterium]|nr:MAG: glycerate kinase [Chloroflexota bacterium]
MALKIVVAPNSFKGSLSATQAARAIGRGVLLALPDAQIVEVPVADGGDGTVDALVTAHQGTFQWVNVEGPLGDPVHASYGLIDGGKTAVIELATASGFELITAARRDPNKTSTYGFGQLLEAARSAGVTKVIAGIGGSATNDAGAGMAQAIGYRLLDETGGELAGTARRQPCVRSSEGCRRPNGRAARSSAGQLRESGRARPRQAGGRRARRRRGRGHRGGLDRVPGRQPHPRGASGRANRGPRSSVEGCGSRDHRGRADRRPDRLRQGAWGGCAPGAGSRRSGAVPGRDEGPGLGFAGRPWNPRGGHPGL